MKAQVIDLIENLTYPHFKFLVKGRDEELTTNLVLTVSYRVLRVSLF